VGGLEERRGEKERDGKVSRAREEKEGEKAKESEVGA